MEHICINELIKEYESEKKKGKLLKEEGKLLKEKIYEQKSSIYRQ